MSRRAFGSMVVLISILTLPYWIYIPILYIAIVLFPFFWEGILFTFLINIIYGNGIDISFSLIPPSALSVLVILTILLPLRRRLRSYA